MSLFDLGYVDGGRFIRAIERGAHSLTRLKTSHNPRIARVHVGKGDKRKARGMTLEDALESRALASDDGLIDLDVILEKGDRTAIVRAVASQAHDGAAQWYLTTIDRDVLDPRETADVSGHVNP